MASPTAAATRSSRAGAADQLAELVPRLYRLLRTTLDQDPASPSLEQLRVMQRIEQGLRNVSALAAARQLRMSAITATLDALAGRGWVTRRPDPVDRRRTTVELTAAGRAALRRGRRRATDGTEAILERYPGTTAELRAVLRGLDEAVRRYEGSSGGPRSR